MLSASVLAAATMVAAGAMVARAGAAAGHAGAPHDEPHGVNFVLKSSVDANFCIEARPMTNGTKIQVEPCNGAKDGQHWTFAWDADKSVVIVESNGECLDAKGFANGASVKARTCTFSTTSERFYYSTKQRLQNRAGTMCLGVTGSSVGGKPVIVQKCSTAKGQVWILGF